MFEITFHLSYLLSLNTLSAKWLNSIVDQSSTEYRMIFSRPVNMEFAQIMFHQVSMKWTSNSDLTFDGSRYIGKTNKNKNDKCFGRCMTVFHEFSQPFCDEKKVYGFLISFHIYRFDERINNERWDGSINYWNYSTVIFFLNALRRRSRNCNCVKIFQENASTTTG